MRWEGCELIECSTEGGEVIKVQEWRSPHPLQPASQQGAKRRRISWQVEPGGGWRSDGGLGKIFGFSFSNKKSVLNHLGAREWLGLPGPVFG